MYDLCMFIVSFCAIKQTDELYFCSLEICLLLI